MNPILIGVLLAVLGFIGWSTWRAPRLTSVIWWALLATVFLGAALLKILPGPFSEKALWLTLILPIIWAVLQFWTYWERRAWLVAAAFIGISVCCGAYVFLTPPIA